MRLGRTIGVGVLLLAVTVAVASAADRAKGRPVIGKPVRSTAHPLSSKRFTLTYKVTRSDNHAPLTGATVVSRPKIDGRVLPHTDGFRRGKAIVSLVVPPDAMGKSLQVKVVVQVRGASVTRTESFDVLRGQPIGSLSIDDESGQEGGLALEFTVRLSAPDPQPVTVTYRTHDVTAVEWRDYSPALDTVTFQPGETTKTFQDVTWRDREAEPDETFVVELSDPVNATIADGSATGTILANTSTP